MEAARAVAVDTVAPADVERAVAVIVLAFSADPVARWAYPDPRQYLTLFPPLVRAFGGKVFAEGTAAPRQQLCGGSAVAAARYRSGSGGARSDLASRTRS